MIDIAGIKSKRGKTTILTGVINLMKPIQKPEHIMVKCSGAADPSQVLRTPSTPLLNDHLNVHGVFTGIDCSQLLGIGKEHLGLVERQIHAVNWLIFSKFDRMDSQLVKQVKRSALT
jgi:G3E family GTPase